jgi:pSer/pThr/pTyr-binding forkhead associated (FHA) protein
MASEGLHVETVEKPDDGATAFLVDLVSNRKIPITTPRCKVGRDDLNDIVISGDQSISRFHFVITKENNQYLVQDGKSRHGTFLNGNQITVPEPIHDGDVLKVGVSLFWFVIESVVLGGEGDKSAPVDMEADEAELEFGAPEPSAGHLVAGTKPAGAPRASISSLTETGAFPALDMSTPEVEAFTARIKESSGQSLIESLTQHSSQSSTDLATDAASSKAAADPADMMQSFIDKAHEEFAASSEEKKEGAVPAASEDSSSHSYRPPHQSDSAVLNTMPGAEDFGTLSFSEPLTEVINELGTDTLTGKDLSSAEASSAPAESEAASSLDASSQSVDEVTSTVANGNVSSEDKSSDSEKSSVLKESLGASTLDPAEEEQPSHNAFGLLFESDSLTGSSLHASNPLENSLDFRTDEASTAAEQMELSPDQAVSGVTAAVDSETTAQHAAEASSASTLDKLAEAIGEAGSLNSPIPSKEDSILVQLINEAYATQAADVSESHENGGRDGNGLSNEKTTSNGAKSLMSTTKESLNATVPDWCNRYFAGELTRLSKELTDLNEQVRYAQQKIKEVEGRVSLAKGLRNTLLTATGEELVEGCGRVLSLLGWKVKISDDDKNELRIETDEKHTCIARIVYTETQADRTHLGQLSISQTRYWCEQGIEPKGILIVSRSGESGPHALTASDMNSELADYASKKNVCLMTTLQLLAIFKDIALHDGSMETARATVMASNGWLPGFNLEPGEYEKEETSTNKLSSLLSA